MPQCPVQTVLCRTHIDRKRVTGSLQSPPFTSGVDSDHRSGIPGVRQRPSDRSTIAAVRPEDLPSFSVPPCQGRNTPPSWFTISLQYADWSGGRSMMKDARSGQPSEVWRLHVSNARDSDICRRKCTSEILSWVIKACDILSFQAQPDAFGDRRNRRWYRAASTTDADRDSVGMAFGGE